jgi:hypothetical protein
MEMRIGDDGLHVGAFSRAKVLKITLRLALRAFGAARGYLFLVACCAAR